MREIFEDVGDEIFSEGLTLIDFYGTWCEPCKVMERILDEAEPDFPDVSMAKVDIDGLPSVASRFDVHVLPTLILFKDGEELRRYRGIMNKLALKEWLKV